MDPIPVKFGRVSGYAYTLNSVIGAGFLSVPWAFQKSGWVLAMGMQVTFLLIGWLLTDQLLEVTSRVEAIKQYEEQGKSLKPISVWKALQVGFSCKETKADSLIDMPEPMLSDVRQYDLTEIVKILKGVYWCYFYLLCISLSFAGVMAAYVNIFATAFGTNVPILEECDYSDPSQISMVCRHQYWMYIGVFFILMVYFTCIEFHEALWMQLLMTGIRIMVMSTIIVACFYSYYTKSNLSDDASYEKGNPPLADYTTLGQTFPIFMFAGMYQTQYPGILSAIKKDKAVLKSILIAVTLTLISFYCVLGVVASLAIPHVSTNVSLSFETYTAGYSTDDRPQWALVLSYLIILFPAIDVVSIFPIIGHAISDNVMSLLYSSDRESLRRNHKLVYYSLRLGCLLPSFCYAFFEIEFGSIVSNSGILTFYLTFFTIPLLHIAGKILVRKPSYYDIPHNPLVRTHVVAVCYHYGRQRTAPWTEFVWTGECGDGLALALG